MTTVFADLHDATMTSHYFSGSTIPASSNTAADATGAFSVPMTITVIYPGAILVVYEILGKRTKCQSPLTAGFVLQWLCSSVLPSDFVAS